MTVVKTVRFALIAISLSRLPQRRTVQMEIHDARVRVCAIYVSRSNNLLLKRGVEELLVAVRRVVMWCLFNRFMIPRNKNYAMSVINHSAQTHKRVGFAHPSQSRH